MKRVLFLLAHQDDENLICLRIRDLLKEGNDLYFAWATDGMARLKEQRESESRAALSWIGVPSKNLFFLNFPCGHCLRHPEAVYEAIMALVLEIQPQEVYVPAYDGWHADHDLLNFIAAMLRRHSLPHTDFFEFPSSHRHRRFFPVFNTFIPGETPVLRTPPDFEFRRRFFSFYRSQRRVKSLAILFGDRRDARLGEPYRRLPEHDYNQPPHAGKLLYESYLSYRFSDFLKATRAIEERVAIEKGGNQTRPVVI